MNKNTFYAGVLKKFAKLFLKRHNPYIIGITGSIGKTTAREILSQTASEFLREVKISSSPKNFNSEIWLPLAILWITSFTPGVLGSIKAFFQALSKSVFWSGPEVLLLEYGIDNLGDMDVLLSIALPDIAIFTGLDFVHSEGLWSPDEILAEKSKLLYAAKDIVCVPAHKQYLHEVISKIAVDVLEYSSKNGVQTDIWFDQYEILQDEEWQIKAEFVLDQWHDTLLAVQTNLIGEINAWYICLSLELMQVLAYRKRMKDYTLPEVVNINYMLQPWRATFFTLETGHILLDSSYNASPKSMLSTLQLAVSIRNQIYPDMPLVYCLGDMNELGEFAEQEHRKMMWHVSQSAEQIFLLGSQMKKWGSDELEKLWYMTNKIHIHQNPRSLWSDLAQYLQKSTPSFVVFKSSQWWLYMEEAIPYVHKNISSSELCRQEKWWKVKKDIYRKSTDVLSSVS